MKTLFKWAAIFTLPSIAAFLYMVQTIPHTPETVYATFITVHYMSAGVATFFVLRALKKVEDQQSEKYGILRYMITGILTSVAHGLIFGLISASYYNVIQPDIKSTYVEEVLTPSFVRGKDSTANTIDEYYDHLMAGKDSGVLLPERYAAYKQAAQDSVTHLKEIIATVEAQNFSYSGTIFRFVGLAPVFGILFSVIIVVYLKR